MTSLRYGLYVPNLGECAYARTLAEFAVEAERAGWDGFFLWDTILFEKARREPMVDSFTALAAMSVNTRQIRIGTTITPLPRRRPWKVARETVSIDHLSDGRLILGVGLGDPPDIEFETFGEDGGNKIRAEKLDEGLDILVGFWSGKEFSYEGKHYRVDKAVFSPRPRQNPRIPIWVGGIWPNKAPFRRAARWDGAIPVMLEGGRIRPPEPGEIREIIAYVRRFRSNVAPFDVAVIGRATSDRKPNIQLYEQEGVTWWLESLTTYRNSPEEMRERIRQGPATAL